VLLPGFELIDLLDSAEVDGVDSQPIEGVGGHRDEIPLAQTGNNVIDPVRLGLIGMDTQYLRGQMAYPVTNMS
jgi:hypothetical protein